VDHDWDRAGAERTVPAAAAYKMDFIEIALLNAPAVDTSHTASSWRRMRCVPFAR
jgi:hypothetical protein